MIQYDKKIGVMLYAVNVPELCTNKASLKCHISVEKINKVNTNRYIAWKSNYSLAYTLLHIVCPQLEGDRTHL